MMKIIPADDDTHKLVEFLNERYLHLDMRRIKLYDYDIYEYDPKQDLKVAWSDARAKKIFLERGAFPRSLVYGAFILAHEVAHIRLEHFGKKLTKKQRLQEHFDASTCARFAIAGEIGPARAKRVMIKWYDDWASRLPN